MRGPLEAFKRSPSQHALDRSVSSVQVVSPSLDDAVSRESNAMFFLRASGAAFLLLTV